MAQETWGEYYHAIAGDMALYRQSNRHLVAAAELRPGMRVLDLASGSGLTALAALEAVPEGLDLTLLDASPSMIEAARSRIGDRAGAYHAADAVQVAGLVEGKLDRVLCNLSFWYFKDAEAVMRELRKVLKPTGRLCFTLLGTFFNTGGGVVSPQWAFMRDLHDRGLLRHKVPDVERLPNQRSIEGTLSGAGFKPFFYKMDEVVVTAPETEPGGELHSLMQLYPALGGATRAEAVARTLAELPASAEAIAQCQPRWRTVTFMAQPALTAEEAILTRFGGKLPPSLQGRGPGSGE